MVQQQPCKYECGQNVSADMQTCPRCGGQQPWPEPVTAAGPGWFEKLLIIVFIVGGLASAIGLIVTKLIVG